MDGLHCTFLNDPLYEHCIKKQQRFKNDEDLIKALKRSKQLMKIIFPNEKEPIVYWYSFNC